MLHVAVMHACSVGIFILICAYDLNTNLCPLSRLIPAVHSSYPKAETEKYPKGLELHLQLGDLAL